MKITTNRFPSGSLSSANLLCELPNFLYTQDSNIHCRSRNRLKPKAMKYLICTLLVTGFLGSKAIAQVQFGLRAGANSVNAYVVNPDGSKPETRPGTGFFAGAMLKVPFETKLYFVPGIQYSYKTYTIEYNDASTKASTMNLHYIEVPLLLNYDFKTSGSYPFIQFGPSFSIAMSGNQVVSKPGEMNSTEKMTFSYTSYGRYEANAVLNAGIHFKNNLSVFGGYALGLGTIVNDDNGPVIKHRMFSLGLGYTFNK